MTQGDGQIEVFFNLEQKQVALSTKNIINHEGLLNGRYHLPLELVPGTPLEMQVFIDGNLLEVYANGKYMACRVIFDEPSMIQTGIFCEAGSARILNAEAWDMDTAWLIK